MRRQVSTTECVSASACLNGKQRCGTGSQGWILVVSALTLYKETVTDYLSGRSEIETNQCTELMAVPSADRLSSIAITCATCQ